eukprot:g253.t1
MTKHIASDNNKLRQAIEDVGLFLVQQDHVGPEILVIEHLLSPSNRTVSWRDLAGRLRLLSRVILTLGIAKRNGEPPMTLDYIMSRVVEHLQHPNNHVRSAAINVSMACYKFCGGDVERYFGGLRQSLLDLLQAGFLEVEDEKIRENAVDLSGTPRMTVQFKDNAEVIEEYTFEEKVDKELDEFYLSTQNKSTKSNQAAKKEKNEAIKKIEDELKVAIPKLKIEKESFYSSDDSSGDDLIVIEDEDEVQDHKEELENRKKSDVEYDKTKPHSSTTFDDAKSVNKQPKKSLKSNPKSKYVVEEEEEGVKIKKNDEENYGTNINHRDDNNNKDAPVNQDKKKNCVVM